MAKDSFFDELSLEAQQLSAAQKQDELMQESFIDAGFDLNRMMTAMKSLLPIIQSAVRNSQPLSEAYEYQLLAQIKDYIKEAVNLTNLMIDDLSATGVDVDSWQNRWTTRKLFHISCVITDLYLQRHGRINGSGFNEFGLSILSMVTKHKSSVLLATDKRSSPYYDLIKDVFKGHKDILDAIEEDDGWENPPIALYLYNANAEALAKMAPAIIKCPMGTTVQEALNYSSDVIESGVKSVLTNTLNYNVPIPEESLRMLLASAFDKASSILYSIWDRKTNQLIREKGIDFVSIDISESEALLRSINSEFVITMSVYNSTCTAGKDFVDKMLDTVRVTSLNKVP